MARPGRNAAVAGLCAALSMLAVAVWVCNVNRRERALKKPHSEVFRQYLADRRSRLVIYAPVIDESGSSQAVIERQLALLRQKFDGLVLYQCDDQTQVILDAAVRLHYRAVMLTVWAPQSRDEIEIAARLVRAFQGKIALAVSLGSEGLMEGRYTAADLATAQARLWELAHTERNVEITTTEPWWLYLHTDRQADALREFGDFLCVNIHVVWDADIFDPSIAAEWTRQRAEQLQTATNRIVLVREAGFPGGGFSPRGSNQAQFTRQLQAEFWTDWLRQESESGKPFQPFAVLEGFNNPAKSWRGFESQWGLFDQENHPYPAWNSFPLI